MSGIRPADALQRLFELTEQLQRIVDDGLDERNLTRSRARVLWYVRRDGAMTSRALSRLLDVTPRSVTGLVDRLEQADLVERAPHPHDRRASLIRLTDAGDSLVDDLDRDQHAQAETLFGATPAEQLASFVSVVEHLLDRIDPRNDEST